MASIQPGTFVTVLQGEAAKLNFPPPTMDVQVAVHTAAIPKSGPSQALLTTLIHRSDDGAIDWIGSIDEAMLTLGRRPGATPRQEIKPHLFQSEECWSVFYPGRLVPLTFGEQYLTIYGGDRPWVTIGQLGDGKRLAVPLNGVGNRKWYTPEVSQKHLLFVQSKTSQMELPHIWSFPSSIPAVGTVANEVRNALAADCLKYF